MPVRLHRLLASGAAVLLLTVGPVVACGGANHASDDSTTTTEVPLPVDFPLVDRSPATVTLGHQFGLVLPAEPTAGRRWVVTAYDAAVLLPLGVQFEQDPRLLTMGLGATTTTSSTTTTTIWTPPTSSTSTTSTTTTTPSMPDRAQLLSFVGRVAATTTITLRYERVGVPDPAPATIVFTIVVKP